MQLRHAFRSWASTFICVAAVTSAAPATAANLDQEDAERIAELVVANQIIADQGVVDGFGHISVRSAKNPNHYFILEIAGAGAGYRRRHHGIRS